MMDRQFEDTMKALMVATLTEDLAKMKRLSLPDDNIRIADLVHRMTGSLRIAHQTRLAQACLHFEAQCRHGTTKTAVPDVMYKALQQRLEHYLLRLRHASTLADVTEEND